MKATTKGSKTVQQKVISESYLILGKDALTQTNINTNTQVFIPNTTPYKAPSNSGLSKLLIRELKGYK
jgi:hypothetical protein